MTDAPKTPKGGGNILTRKFGPLPAWAWAGLAVGGWLIYKQRKAAKAGGSSTTSTQPSLPLSYQAAPSGYGYQGPGVGGGGAGPVPTGATAAVSNPSSLVGETLMGGGFGNPTGVGANQSIVTQEGNFVGLAAPQQAAEAQQAGQTLYYQATPGNFLPATGVQFQSPTPLYLQTPVSGP